MLAAIRKAMQAARKAAEEGAALEGIGSIRLVDGRTLGEPRSNLPHKDVTQRVPELEESYIALQSGDINKDQRDQIVDLFKPVDPYTELPPIPSVKEIKAALTSTQGPKVGMAKKLDRGFPASLRLDIPAYTRNNTWVVSVHEQKPGFAAGTPIGYEDVASVTDATFGVAPSMARVASGEKSKHTGAVIKGSWSPISRKAAIERAKKALKSDQWIQVGMDPERHGYFYDRRTMQPVIEAEEVIQIGPLVLAKMKRDAKGKIVGYGNPKDFEYRFGGRVEKR
jgi:hypothetical protein